MKIKDLLPYLPMYSDKSGYCVTINYRIRNKGSFNDWNSITLGKIEGEDSMDFKYPFKSIDEILNLTIENLDSYRSLCGGEVDDKLQIYVSELNYIK